MVFEVLLERRQNQRRPLSIAMPSERSGSTHFYIHISQMNMCPFLERSFQFLGPLVFFASLNRRSRDDEVTTVLMVYLSCVSSKA